METNTNHSIEREALVAFRSDCKHWRKLVSECAKTDVFVQPFTEEQYRLVHGRILEACRDLAEQKSVPASRRQIALQLDELLRPWSSTKSLQEAPANLVCDLVKQQTSLDERLRRPRRSIIALRLRKLLLIACLAGVGGTSIVLLLQSTSGTSSTPWQGLLASIAAFLERTTFTEQLAVVVFVSWLFGTWTLSRLSKS